MAQDKKEDEEKEAVNEGSLATKVKTDILVEAPLIRPNIKKFLIPILRRATYRWSPRSEAYKAARVERGRYRCASCGDTFAPKEVDLDHVDPVVSLKEGFVDWNVYINRLFPEVEGWQILCKTCHMVKTVEEDHLRAFYNQDKKPKKKKKAKKA